MLHLRKNDIVMRIVKGCTRCVITTTDQQTGQRNGDEPLKTLLRYRMDRRLRGVVFGQNVIAIAGIGEELVVGDTLEATWGNGGVDSVGEVRA